MSWIIIEGVDRVGKSTVSGFYQKQGYEMVHMSAPDKKYTRPGYVGPSYLDEMIDLLMKYDGRDVVFDRSWYGECVWPMVYGREPLLTDDDIDVIREYEERNQVRRILMIDTDTAAHWKRCVDNKEPLNFQQFQHAHTLYSKLAHKYHFEVISLPEFNKSVGEKDKIVSTAPAVEELIVPPVPAPIVPAVEQNKLTAEQETLERANAINSILRAKRLFKQAGWPYDEIETKVRTFLNDQLGDLLGLSKSNSALSTEDVLIVKEFVKRLKERQGVK